MKSNFITCSFRACTVVALAPCLLLWPRPAQADPDAYLFDSANRLVTASGNQSDGVYLLSGDTGYNTMIIQNLTTDITGIGNIWNNTVPGDIALVRLVAEKLDVQEYLRFPAIGMGFGNTGQVGPATTMEFAGGTHGIYASGAFSIGLGAFSVGGNGAAGRSSNGGPGGDGGPVTVINHGSISALADIYTYYVLGIFPLDFQGLSYGIVAISDAGDGGRGDFGWWTGGKGGKGGAGGSVRVENYGNIVATSHGITAQSYGGAGGDGGNASGLVYGKGGAAAGSGPGGDVTVVNAGNIKTTGSLGIPILDSFESVWQFFQQSHGILAQSIGGAGGSAGIGVGIFSRSGNAQSAGDGGIVTVVNSGTISASGDFSSSIFAQSIGGGGGDGGASIGLFDLDAGHSNPSRGGNGGTVRVINSGTLVTSGGNEAPALFAQSIGGGGGRGSFSAAAFFSVGGSGGRGGDGGYVEVQDAGLIATEGSASSGIFAQSVGGGGGRGGASIAVGANFSASIGGDGGGGGNGGTVSVSKVAGTIVTGGDTSHGIFAQSIGGGGGDGGFAISISGGKCLSFSGAIGGKGGPAGDAGVVTVNNAGAIATQGGNAAGVFAQSVGGRGGNGGFAFSASASDGVSLNLSVGGDGGGGGKGSNVTVTSTGQISTEGLHSPGINVESIGGGGGNGGTAASLSVPVGKVTLTATIGGKGGSGNTGGNVQVSNGGAISTTSDASPGIYLKSIGGGGGNGGNSLAYSFSAEGESGSKPNVSFSGSLMLGGDGGSGNSAGTVTAYNLGGIHTAGDMSHGIYAQSIGGGGGNGGDPNSVSIDFGNGNPFASGGGTQLSFDANVGGTGGNGNRGGKVDVSNGGYIFTEGAFSHGIFAQSIGGGGGSGGGGEEANTFDNVLSSAELLYSLKDAINPLALSLAVGGNGGMNSDGDTVTLRNTGSITTMGLGSDAIFAQSIGGGGGEAQLYAKGSGLGGTAEGGLLTKIAIGGKAGSGGNGAVVTVENQSALSTFGDNARGILAQSIGGGGGTAGTVTRDLPFGLRVIGLGVSFARNGGGAGDGNTVTVNNSGSITTHGAGADGIFAQSVGGGGGQAAGNDPLLGNVFFAGSVGGDGAGGAVRINHSGSIITFGRDADGIFAQSAGGTRAGAPVSVTVSGNVMAVGTNSVGIFAQSTGKSGAGNLSVQILSGAVQGGRTPDASLGEAPVASGVRFDGGAANTLENRGTITSIDGAAGMAISSTNSNPKIASGNLSIANYGTITGSIDLGSGNNTFHNYAGAVFNAGPSVRLGSGVTLINDGALCPGGGACGQTVLHQPYQQTRTGSLVIDLEPCAGACDRLQVEGAATLDGNISVFKGQGALATNRCYGILSASGGVTGTFANNNFTDRPLLAFSLAQASDNLQIAASPNSFASVASNSVAAAMAVQLDALLPSVSGDLGNIVGEMQNQSGTNLTAAFSSLSPESYDAYTLVSLNLVGQYARSLQERLNTIRIGDAFGVPVQSVVGLNPVLLASAASGATIGKLEEQQRNQDKLNGVWVGGFGQFSKRQAEDGYSGFEFTPWGTSLGYDRAFGKNFILGASAAYGSASLTLDDNLGGGRIDSYDAALYGSYLTGPFNFEGVLSYGYNDYNTHRVFSLGSINRPVQSTHSGQALGGFLSAGYLKKLNHFALQPFVSLQCSHLDESAFDEYGGGGASLLVQDHATTDVTSGLGLRTAYVFRTRNFALIPEVSLAWDYDFNTDDRTITAAFAGSPASTFSIPGQHISANSCEAGVGLTLLVKKSISTSVRYRGALADDFTSHNISGEFRFAF